MAPDRPDPGSNLPIDEDEVYFQDFDESRELLFHARLTAAEEAGEVVDYADPRLYRPQQEDIPDRSRATNVAGRGCMIGWHCREVRPGQYTRGCEAGCPLTWQEGNERPTCFGYKEGVGLKLQDFQLAELRYTCLVCPFTMECQEKTETRLPAPDLPRPPSQPVGIGRSFIVGGPRAGGPSWIPTLVQWAQQVADKVQDVVFDRFCQRHLEALRQALAEPSLEVLPAEARVRHIRKLGRKGRAPRFYPTRSPKGVETYDPLPPAPRVRLLRSKRLGVTARVGWYYQGNEGTTLLSELRPVEALLPVAHVDAGDEVPIRWDLEAGAWRLAGRRTAAKEALDTRPADWDVEANVLLLEALLLTDGLPWGRFEVEPVLLEPLVEGLAERGLELAPEVLVPKEGHPGHLLAMP